MSTCINSFVPYYVLSAFDVLGQESPQVSADAWVRLLTGPFGAIVVLVLWVWWFQNQQRKQEVRQEARDSKTELMQERQISALERMNQFTAQNTTTIKELTTAIQALHEK